jgi:hypothetical protein
MHPYVSVMTIDADVKPLELSFSMLGSPFQRPRPRSPRVPPPLPPSLCSHDVSDLTNLENYEERRRFVKKIARLSIADSTFAMFGRQTVSESVVDARQIILYL